MKAFVLSARRAWTLLAILGACFVLDVNVSCADTAGVGEEPGEQVLTRGPVHEAFAGVIAYKPEPGIVAPKAPPSIIEEVPPDQKPEGDNVTWIPGYWAWDDERNDFLWVSGVWRALPPGRQWVPGYWGKSSDGYQWTSGYWADTSETATTYLPEPPATLENGPNIAAPSDDDVWIPGCWIWLEGRYVWQPGYWIGGREDWDWIPDYYVWTPRGYVFVDGYWDYSIERRGVLFAPVYFESDVYARPGYGYTPTVAIDLNVLPNHLFLRPRYHHYYFGDYYDAAYASEGFFISFAFQSGGHGYDPIFAHRRWEHRQDHDWESRIETKYRNRQEHRNTRPPRTWAAQKSAAPGPKPAAEDMPVATPFKQLSKGPDNPRQFHPLPSGEKQQFEHRGQEVKQSRDERRTLELNAPVPPPVKPGQPFKPFVAERPRSPIFSRPFSQPRRDLAPPRPDKTREQNKGGGARPQDDHERDKHER